MIASLPKIATPIPPTAGPEIVAICDKLVSQAAALPYSDSGTVWGINDETAGKMNARHIPVTTSAAYTSASAPSVDETAASVPTAAAITNIVTAAMRLRLC